MRRTGEGTGRFYAVRRHRSIEIETDSVDLPGRISSAGEKPMAVRIVRLGSRRARGEGLRIGTVRRPPRGVPKSEFAKRNYYDVWLPDLSPSPAAVKVALAATNDREWARFERQFRREMSRPEARRLLDLLAALSHHSNFSVGCYCEEESRCHRGVLRSLFEERKASIL